jgi:hypothetical protein
MYRIAIAILRMPTGLDFSFAVKANGTEGHYNDGFDHFTEPMSRLDVVSSKIMHANSNLDLSGMNSNGNSNQSSMRRQPGKF